MKIYIARDKNKAAHGEIVTCLFIEKPHMESTGFWYSRNGRVIDRIPIANGFDLLPGRVPMCAGGGRESKGQTRQQAEDCPTCRWMGEGHYERQAMKTPHIATRTKEIKGKFTLWPIGMVVKAIHVRGSSYAIERLKWTKGKLPLLNQCCGVPRSALKFEADPRAIAVPRLWASSFGHLPRPAKSTNEPRKRKAKR